MRSKFLQWLAVILVLEIGMLHFASAQAEYEEAAYMGYLFVANFMLALMAAYGIYRKYTWGWFIGFGIAALSIAGYLISRTVGMPQMAVEEWYSPIGLSAMIVEGLFISVALLELINRLSPENKVRVLLWIGIGLINLTGVLHLVAARDKYIETPYIGLLFIANFIASLIAALGMYRGAKWSWVLGAFIALGSIAGYVASRTVGMPGMEVEAWYNPIGLTALAVETLFVLLFIFEQLHEAFDPEPIFSQRLAVTFAMFCLVLGNISVYRWDVAFNSSIPAHQHVGSLDDVCNTAPTSLTELEQKYGIRIYLVGISAMGSVVDVRLKIVDADKAHALLANQVALLVDSQRLVLAPHMHSHHKIKSGGVYFMFFPTQRNTIKSGAQISLIFGQVRIASIAAK